MSGLYNDLVNLRKEGSPIRVGVVGAGQMGTGMIAQIATIPGIAVYGIADINKEAMEFASDAYLDHCLYPHKVLMSTDFNEIINNEKIDIVVEATGITEVGAQVAMACLLAKKHLVLLNVEVDVTIGPLMKKLFDSAGLVYSGADGDEPAVINSMYEFAQSMGLEILVAGKGKNNPLQIYANPDTAKSEAESKGMNPAMLAAFQDGTKTMAEMNLLSNATGFKADIPGMHGIKGDLDSTLDQLKLKQDGGILNNYKVVEYVDGLAPGVFLIVKGQNDLVAAEMDYLLKKGKQDRHILYRPFHLASLETPRTIAKAVLYGQAAIAPMGAPVSDTVAVAKRDIKAGELIDGIGGYSVRGILEDHESLCKEDHVPIGIISGNTRAARDIAKDKILEKSDLEFDTNEMVYRLRMLQDQILG